MGCGSGRPRGGVWRSRLLVCAYGGLLAGCRAGEQCEGTDGLRLRGEDQAISTSVDLIGTDMVAGFTTYQVKIHLAESAANCYAIYGEEAVWQIWVPPSYQCDTPFGVDVGGTNPVFWPVANSAELGFSQYDSWLTVGVTDGDGLSAITSVGLDFSAWDENTGLASDDDIGGAVFWMNPSDASGSVDPDSRTMVVAQLTVRSSEDSAHMSFNAQGRSVGLDDWAEMCIFVFVGGTQNGQGNHAYNPAGSAPPPARPPPPIAGPPPTAPSPPTTRPPPSPSIEVSPTPWLSLYIPSPPECPLSDVRARIAELDSACCTGGACQGGINNGAPISCSPMCGGKMLNLYSKCNQTLDVLFDGQDGNYDGVASTFSDLRQTCLQLSPSSVIDETKRLQDSGCELNANGVGQEAVQQRDDGGCRNNGSPELCALIPSGALSCHNDFCQDRSICAHSGACDQTCGFCRRRSQIDLDGGCSPLTLQSLVEPINEACCDEDGAYNGGGVLVPTVCDARCAIVYGPFYEQCRPTLEMHFGADRSTFAAFSQLALACNSLPVDQLLEATAATICPNAERATQPNTGGFGNWLDAALDCPLSAIERFAVSIDNQCCADDPDNCFWPEGGSPAECNLECGVAMIGSNTHCTKTMDLVLDGMDGDRDGQCHVFDNLYRKCNAIPSRAVILHLKELQDQGCPVDANGVSETTVDTTRDDTCVDTADSTLCSLVESGLLSCSVDFCPEVCPHAYACDATCGFCQTDNKHNHLSVQNGRRSLQINIDNSPCGASEFPARTDRVNVQCCDNNQCNSGVPTSCDAKCAMEYLSYYSECAAQIAVTFPPPEQYALANLRQTCMSLPLQPLMAVAATIECDSTEPGSSSPSRGSCSDDVTLLSHAASVRYSIPAHNIMGMRQYDEGTIAVIKCLPGYQPSINGTAMACKHGAWSDETGTLIRCLSGH